MTRTLVKDRGMTHLHVVDACDVKYNDLDRSLVLSYSSVVTFNALYPNLLLLRISGGE